MQRPKLVQCLCPNRHVQISLRFLNIDDPYAKSVMQQMTAELIYRDHAMAPFCLLCGATDKTWTCEVCPLEMPAWESEPLPAPPVLRQQHRDNIHPLVRGTVCLGSLN